MTSIISTLEVFRVHSGLSANPSKCKVYFSPNTSVNLINSIEATLNIPSCPDLGTYLGFPLTSKRPTLSALQSVVNKMNSRLAGWKIHHLSKAARLTFIKSTLSSLSSYLGSCILFPKKISNSCDKICRDFY